MNAEKSEFFCLSKVKPKATLEVKERAGFSEREGQGFLEAETRFSEIDGLDFPPVFHRASLRFNSSTAFRKPCTAFNLSSKFLENPVPCSQKPLVHFFQSTLTRFKKLLPASEIWPLFSTISAPQL